MAESVDAADLKSAGRKTVGVQVSLPPSLQEKTLFDCFRHRRRLGMGFVLEALKDAISQRGLNVDEPWQQARVHRMQRVMVPYLEALL